jgi:hypothetical protein
MRRAAAAAPNPVASIAPAGFTRPQLLAVPDIDLAIVGGDKKLANATGIGCPRLALAWPP